ncbi:low molecular weight phosphotyrosine protein phosphatase-like [Musca vetustissima]|uniref:low molecular weight phosphotyrosine protein phosphatase-like n=1 Tax=Musca vetustissima TaxID=27455 RepID=UPI002AB6FC59|nr:low molecular weight phosphotyrosine protein phosphatase-like [Musca vetustissima]XP_061399172.1 low molecular weight phosphotyrosine protein phosphatase-like [Musca vetustissima]
MGRLRILFICIGNTCRSPMAEGILKHLALKNQLDWIIDSAALRSWNVGRKPEERCLKVLDDHGIKLKHYGRMITMEDFEKFDYILGMDESNLNELQVMADMAGKKCRAKVGLLGTYLDNYEMEIIKDPYFSKGMSAFCSTFDQVYESCLKLIEKHRFDNVEHEDDDDNGETKEVPQEGPKEVASV